MKWSGIVIVGLMLTVLLLAACGGGPTPAPTPLPTENTTFESPLDMANPASVFCEEQGYRLEIRQEAGGEVGYCLFPDGSECEEWAFYRGECGPQEGGEGAGLPNPAAQFCEEKGYTYEIRTAEDGSQAGYCILPNGVECEEWAFYRGECGAAEPYP